ncbi:MAG: hypothetical protein C5B51_23675 [Terriglobia bacterium]|nr:MAG: hypothetical protein C5B51_23675 [Terriglobia bacterium]
MLAVRILLIAAALVTGACQSKSKPDPKPLLVGWRPIGTWSGHGNEQTDSFEIGSGQFRLKWETRNEAPPGSGTFRVMVHSGVSGRPIALGVEYKGVGRDTAYVSDDPRPYYLVIESSNVDWSITVQEAVAGSVPAP